MFRNPDGTKDHYAVGDLFILFVCCVFKDLLFTCKRGKTGLKICERNVFSQIQMVVSDEDPQFR